MNRRFAPPASSLRVFTLESSSSFEPLPSTSPVIGMTTKSLSSSVGCARRGGAHNMDTAEVRHATRILLNMMLLHHYE